ncbi:hypothetical protein A2U01_0079596, partial [Trifolium medium]|nr:hypothetical protein [Trifolium medium]
TDSLRSSLKRGSACWADLATKRDKDVSMPLRDWTDFFESGVGNVVNALHLSGLASIPRSVR